MRVLVIESDKKSSLLLKRFLEEEAFVVDLARHGDNTSYLVRNNDYDLIVIDNEFPARNGIRMCVDIRSTGSGVPIVALISSDELEPRLQLLTAGADDCLVKPYSFSELLVRIRAIFRRGPTIKSEVHRADGIVLDPRSQQVWVGQKLIFLSKKEFALLELLLKNKNAVVTRTTILEQVWDLNGDPKSKTLETHIFSLRKKLGKPKKCIRNVQGRGYLIQG